MMMKTEPNIEDPTKCATCDKTDAEHVFVEGRPFHVFTDAATQARRDTATDAFKARYNQTYAAARKG